MARFARLYPTKNPIKYNFISLIQLYLIISPSHHHLKMVCPICNATTHKKMNCPIKHEYSALLYKYVIDTYINWGQLTVLLSNAAYSLSQMTNMEIDLLGEFIVDKKQYHTPL
jgi:hypothetical protein